jgi:phage terminase small subunit
MQDGNMHKVITQGLYKMHKNNKGSESMLTPKQEKFAQSIALEDMNKSDAYRSAYNTNGMSDKTINEKASLLASQDKVRARIKELREQVVSPKIISAQKRKEWLTEVINNPNMDINAKLKASDQLNRMEGEYLTRVEGELKMKKLEDLL